MPSLSDIDGTGGSFPQGTETITYTVTPSGGSEGSGGSVWPGTDDPTGITDGYWLGYSDVDDDIPRL